MEGYVGKIVFTQSDKYVSVPDLLREGGIDEETVDDPKIIERHESLHPQDELHWAVALDDVCPVFSTSPTVFPDEWREIDQVTTVKNDHMFKPPAHFFHEDYTGDLPFSHEKLAAISETRPANSPVREEAALDEFVKHPEGMVLFREWTSNRELQRRTNPDGETFEAVLSQGYIYRLYSWRQVYELDGERFSKLVETFDQWSDLFGEAEIVNPQKDSTSSIQYPVKVLERIMESESIDYP